MSDLGGRVTRSASPDDTHQRCATAFGVTAGLLAMASMATPAAATSDTEPVLVTRPGICVPAQPGQPIELDPHALTGQLRQAYLLAAPLDIAGADRAAEQFASQPPLPLGTVQSGQTRAGGAGIAGIAAARLAGLGVTDPAITDRFADLIRLTSPVCIDPQPPASAPPAASPERRTQAPPPPEHQTESAPPAPEHSHSAQPGTTGQQLPPAPALLPETGAPVLLQAPPPAPPPANTPDPAGRDRAATGTAHVMPAAVQKTITLPVAAAVLGLAVAVALLVRRFAQKPSRSTKPGDNTP